MVLCGLEPHQAFAILGDDVVCLESWLFDTRDGLPFLSDAHVVGLYSWLFDTRVVLLFKYHAQLPSIL